MTTTARLDNVQHADLRLRRGHGARFGEAVRLQVKFDDNAGVDFDGYLAVVPEKIAGLDGAALARLNAAGLLDVAVFAAASLGTMPRLIARKQRKLAG